MQEPMREVYVRRDSHALENLREREEGGDVGVRELVGARLDAAGSESVPDRTATESTHGVTPAAVSADVRNVTWVASSAATAWSWE